MVLSSETVIGIEDLPDYMTGEGDELDVNKFVPRDAKLQNTLENIEEQLIRRALKSCNNVQAHAAGMLGITKSLIKHKMKKYNIAV